MEHFETRYPDGEIVTVMIVVELRDEDCTSFQTYCSDDRHWVQKAALNEGLDWVVDRALSPEEEDSDAEGS